MLIASNSRPAPHEILNIWEIARLADYCEARIHLNNLGWRPFLSTAIELRTSWCVLWLEDQSL
jgi:hypothetical protein